MSEFDLPDQLPRHGRVLLPKIARWLYKVLGWTFINDLPNVKKLIIIGAPHTSNWDILPAGMVIYGLDIAPTLLAKDRLFKWPIVRGFIESIGGKPIQQSGKQSYTQRYQQLLETEDKIVLAISPEGTRKKTEQWRTSFLYLTYATGVPVIGATLDIANKTIRLSKQFEFCGDIEQDMLQVKRYFQQFDGYNTNNQSTKV